MDWRYLRHFWRSFRLVLRKWMLAAVRTGEKIRDNPLPFRRLALFFLAGVLFLSALVWGFTRRVTVDKPVPLSLEEDFYSEGPLPGDAQIAGSGSGRAHVPENESGREQALAPGSVRTPGELAGEEPMPNAVNLSRMQEEITELKHRVQELAGEKEKGAWEESAVPAFGRPVQGRLLRSTGWHRYGNEWRYHTGVDLSLPAGRNVMAAAAGRVREIRNDPLLGWVVTIDHNGGWSSLYGHLSEVMITPGFQVQKGTVLGKSSASTCGSEPGIHFSLYHHGNPVDPLSVIPSLAD